MHKLTNMEAQRVITVLEDTLDRLTFLSYVPSSPDDDLLESLSLSGVVPPVRGSLQSQWQLEEGHQVIGAKRASSRPEALAAAQSPPLASSRYGLSRL